MTNADVPMHDAVRYEVPGTLAASACPSAWVGQRLVHPIACGWSVLRLLITDLSQLLLPNEETVKRCVNVT